LAGISQNSHPPNPTNDQVLSKGETPEAQFPLVTPSPTHSERFALNWCRLFTLCMHADGKTPAEACGIEVKGKNKWMTLIQNASRLS